MSSYSQALRFSLLLLFALTLEMGNRAGQAQAVPNALPKFTVIHNIMYPNGKASSTTLSLGWDGNYYGTADLGGTYHFGTVFKITSSGTLTTLHSLTGADGEYPTSKLILGFDGNFYGMAN